LDDATSEILLPTAGGGGVDAYIEELEFGVPDAGRAFSATTTTATALTINED